VFKPLSIDWDHKNVRCVPDWQATFSKKMKEYLVRLIYCEMLGHDASFGYIKVGAMCMGARRSSLKPVGA
jgi:hypothetical protein